MHIRVRINVFNAARGLSLAIRLLPGKVPSFDDLNLLPDLREYCTRRTGLILICGATGSGKSSTIAAFLSEICRTQSRHIVTLEDPIEYRFQSESSFVQQRELGAHMLSYEQGLLDVLREDPDVIMVGELRDPETIRLTLNAVESGHLVIASLHATNSEDALYRMCNSFPPDAQDMVRVQLSSVLSVLLVQKLEYKKEYGFRVPVLSVLRGANSVKSVIRDNRFTQIESILQTGRREGMYTQERYEQEFLAGKSRMTPPSISFRPSVEMAEIRSYRSPLLNPEGSNMYNYIGSKPGQNMNPTQGKTASQPAAASQYDSGSASDTLVESWESVVFALSGIYEGLPISLSQAMGLEQEEGDPSADYASELVYGLVWQIVQYEIAAMQKAYFPDLSENEFRAAFTPQSDFYFDEDGISSSLSRQEPSPAKWMAC